MLRPRPGFIALLSTLALWACPGSSTTGPAADAGVPDGGAVLTTFQAPDPTPVDGSLLLTISGGSAIGGVGFPPRSAGNPYFLDGWQLTFQHVVVVVGQVTVALSPDLDAGDPAQTGPAVARAAGPWAVDVAQTGTLYSKDGAGTAIVLARLTGQNLASGTPAFDPATRYALGYQLVVPSGAVQNVNLDIDAQAALQSMAQNGWSVWFQGTATWRGAVGHPACRQTDAIYDFGRYPQAVTLSLGLATPETFGNCVNPELTPPGTRGVQTDAGAETVAQLTLQVLQPFRQAIGSSGPLRFDVLAGRASVASGAGPANATVTQDELAGLDFSALVDAQGTRIPWRTCGPVLADEPIVGTLAYAPAGVPVSADGGSAGLADLLGFIAYDTSTFGHLNDDGACIPVRAYASPP
jgi:hypothetical protein